MITLYHSILRMTIDLWELAKHNNFENPYYYIDKYNPYILYIKRAYYKKQKNHNIIKEAFDKAQQLTHNSPLVNRGIGYKLYIEKLNDPGSYDRITEKRELEPYFIKKQEIKEAIFVRNPSNDSDEYPTHVAVRYGSTSSGGTLYKKSTIKKHICGRDRVIYLGKHNKQYVKMNGKHVAISSL